MLSKEFDGVISKHFLQGSITKQFYIELTNVFNEIFDGKIINNISFNNYKTGYDLKTKTINYNMEEFNKKLEGEISNYDSVIGSNEIGLFQFLFIARLILKELYKAKFTYNIENEKNENLDSYSLVLKAISSKSPDTKEYLMKKYNGSIEKTNEDLYKIDCYLEKKYGYNFFVDNYSDINSYLDISNYSDKFSKVLKNSKNYFDSRLNNCIIRNYFIDKSNDNVNSKMVDCIDYLSNNNLIALKMPKKQLDTVFDNSVNDGCIGNTISKNGYNKLICDRLDYISKGFIIDKKYPTRNGKKEVIPLTYTKKNNN